MDEAQLVKGHKLERLSITLMNRALRYVNGEKNVEGMFSVQSESEIWWLAAAEIPKENHDTLKWVFERSHLARVVKAQEGGQTLFVEGYGNFSIEWHLAGDLKTLKCLYGCSMGATSEFTCLYCLFSWKEVNDSMHWKKGIFNCNQGAAPSRGGANDSEWDPIFAIPLERVHICTLHAELRVLDKLLDLSIGYAWTMKPASKANKCLQQVEQLLSKMGFHGGHVKIKQDIKKSGKQNRPAKVSMGGAKARRFLSNHGEKLRNSMLGWEYWRDLVQCTTNQSTDPKVSIMRATLWTKLDVFIKLLRQIIIDDDYSTRFVAALNEFMQLMVDSWGASHITHYMHILFAHGPWFVSKYGPLAIWNTQGMEKSHYRAKAAYFKNSRHGGGVGRSNALHEMFDWFYRCLSGRSYKTKKAKQSSLAKAVRVVAQRRKAEIWRRSDAGAKHNLWLRTKTREGTRWISA